jgi:O-antigen/teichoic acid export membrane protein
VSERRESLINRLKPKSEFSRNVLTLMTGTTIAQAMTFLASPLLTRLYTTEEFGILGLYVAMVAILSSIAGGRYEFAIILPKREEDALNIFALSFLLSLVFVIFLSLIIILFHDSITKMFSTDIGIWLYFVPLSVWITALLSFLTLFNNREKNYKDIASSTVIRSSILVLIQLIVGFFKGDVVGLISGQIVSSFFANLKLLKHFIKNDSSLLKITRAEILKMAQRYHKFPLYQMPHALLNSFATQMPILLFSIFFVASVVGLYALATRILFAPLMIIANANAKVYNQSLTEVYNNNEDAYRFSINFLVSLFKKIIVPFLLIVLFAPQLFAFVFGLEWREAGVYTQILSPYILLNVMVSSVAFIAFLLEQQKKSLIISIIHMLLTGTAILVGVYFESIYLALILYMLVSVSVLLYNLIWMLTILKKDVNDKKNLE